MGRFNSWELANVVKFAMIRIRIRIKVTVKIMIVKLRIKNIRFIGLG